MKEGCLEQELLASAKGLLFGSGNIGPSSDNLIVNRHMEMKKNTKSLPKHDE